MKSELEWRAAIERLDGAYADRTLKSYRSDFAIFEAWCVVSDLVALPASPEVVAAFVAADAATSAASTLKRRLCAIRKVHRLLRLPIPVDDEEVAIALRRAMRSKRRRPKQALGLTAPMRDKLIAACPDTLLGLRDRAMIAVGYDTLCRRSELVNLLIEDVTRLPAGDAKILVRRAKNDPFGDGRWAYLSATATRHLEKWLQAAGFTAGPIFRPVICGHVQPGSLQPLVVNRMLKAAAARADLPATTSDGLSGHSMRVGAAQDLMAAGRGLLQIMTAGGWTSVNVVGRYVREADLNVWAGSQAASTVDGSRSSLGAVLDA
jgi:site-specific recombinase XerD